MNTDRGWLDSLNAEIGRQGIAAEPSRPQSIRGGGRKRKLSKPTDELVMTVVEQDGVLRIEDAPVRGVQIGGARRRGPRALGLAGEVMQTTPLSKLESNQIGSALTTLDQRLTPNQGMRELKHGKLVPMDAVRKTGKIFLFVHGTFSNNDMYTGQIPHAENGDAFFHWLEQHYDQVLAYDHPTLAVSPMLNAHLLNEHLKETKASIDTVCHSRGGLVTRWWLEGFDRAPLDKRRVVFVASPLNGTGLAAPPNIKNSLSLLLNIGRVLEKATGSASAIPFMAVVSGLFRIFNSITALAAKTPVVDAAVAMVPGLSGMSRVNNNFELIQQRQPPIVDGRYFTVRSNFEPSDPVWKFWKNFRTMPDRLKNSAADLVFDGKNDLVVDTPSMTNFQDGFRFPYDQVLDYRTSATVHHTNYFEQKRTLEFIMQTFG
ncbi:MAG: hypothetical protein KZQ97_15490 [Candidatus Thiodiazotropha sp. (ex Dulcina madagascariensis)]|nr:hypothetical protein [Candidatus Thiodiazotropha sp. (ex Dulcina madagascariensis)]